MTPVAIVKNEEQAPEKVEQMFFEDMEVQEWNSATMQTVHVVLARPLKWGDLFDVRVTVRVGGVHFDGDESLARSHVLKFVKAEVIRDE